MKACIIAVGSEMLTPFRVDSNSLFITERLNEIGVDVRLKVVVGDDVDELAGHVGGALGWADVIAITGGWRAGWPCDRTARDAFGLGAASGSTLCRRATMASRTCDRIAVPLSGKRERTGA